MILAKEVLRKARVNILRDTDADDFEFSDRSLLDALNDAIQEALKIRPILLWSDAHTCREASEFHVGNVEGSVMLPADLEGALVMGVCGGVCLGLQADEGMAKMGRLYEQRFLQLMAQ